MKNHEKFYEKLQHLLVIEMRIYEVYCALVKCRVQNQRDQYFENIENLKLCVSVEDAEMQDISVALKDIEKFDHELNRVIENSDILDKNALEFIQRRIFNYFVSCHHMNPFVSMEREEAKFLEEYLEVNVQRRIDFSRLSLDFYERCLGHFSDDDMMREKILRFQYLAIIFAFKQLEFDLLGKSFLLDDLEPEGRRRCVSFSLNEKMVNEIYFKEGSEDLNRALSVLLTPGVSEEKARSRYRFYFLEQLGLLEVNFCLLSKEEMFSVAYTIYKEIFENPAYQDDALLHEHLVWINDSISRGLDRVNDRENSRLREKVKN